MSDFPHAVVESTLLACVPFPLPHSPLVCEHSAFSLSVYQLSLLDDLFIFGYITRAAVDVVTLACVNMYSFLLRIYLSLHPDVELLDSIVKLLGSIVNVFNI